MTRDNLVEFPGDLDAAQFRVSGTDAKGHFQKVWVNFQPMHVHMMDVLSSQSNVLPYRNRQDLLRHATMRHFHFLERLRKPVNSVTGAAEAINAILREVEFRMDFENTVEKLMRVVNDLVAHGDKLEAQRLVLNVLREINTMPEGYWRTKYRTTVNERTKTLLDELELATVEELFGEAC